MNDKSVLFHLREAKEELDRTILELESSEVYDVGELRVAMSHLYHHLNTAWNGRDASPQAHRDCEKSDFDAWRKSPKNADLLRE